MHCLPGLVRLIPKEEMVVVKVGADHLSLKLMYTHKAFDFDYQGTIGPVQMPYRPSMTSCSGDFWGSMHVAKSGLPPKGVCLHFGRQPRQWQLVTKYLVIGQLNGCISYLLQDTAWSRCHTAVLVDD